MLGWLLATTPQVYAQGNETNLLIAGERSEISATTNGATVTPAISAGGLLGTLVVHGAGAVTFAAARDGDGVFFSNCCGNTNKAHYKFTGPLVGSIFNVSQGEISFALKSRYSFAQRQQSGASPRYVFDVRDDNIDNHVFYFSTQVSSGRLLFTYRVGGAAQFYYVPAGAEDALFGSGVVLNATITWDGAVSRLYLNDQLVQSSAYTKQLPNWSQASNFNLGAYEYRTFGGYNVCDDVIDSFTVRTPAYVPDRTPPTVMFTSPPEGAVVDGTVTLSVNAWDASGVDSVQFQVDGGGLGPPLTTGGPTYSRSWNTDAFVNGPHTLTAIARDVFGNTATTSINVTVAHEFRFDTRVYTSSTSAVHSGASSGSTVVGNVAQGAFGTISGGPVFASSTNWWHVTFDGGLSGWVAEHLLLVFVPVDIPANRWIVTVPTYSGAPNGGQLYPQSWVNKAAYDPRTHRSIFSDRWYDAVRGGSIFANGIYGYHPLRNTFEVLKLNNFYVEPQGGGRNLTKPLPQNATDPTPVDHHPLTSVEVVPELNAVYTVNGVNSVTLEDLSPLDTTWKLDLGTRSWTMVSSKDTDQNYPPNVPSMPAALVYDPVARRLAYFVQSGCGCSGTTTYLFDPETSRWSIAPRDAASFGVNVAGGAVAYDTRRNRILIFSGGNYLSVPSAALWAYSIADNRWTRLADAPVATTAPAFAYDTKNDVFLALVGNLTYIYDPATDAWTNYGATIERPARAQNWQAVAYNQAYDVFVFQGGVYDAPLFALFRFDRTQPPPNLDTTPPAVQLTAPANGATVSGTVTISASATDDVAMAGVQFKIDGNNLGPIIAGAGPTYSVSWNSGSVADGTHTITAQARDTSGNVRAVSIFVTVSNTTNMPPVISGVAAGGITSAGATISWTTNKPATSQVAYGLTNAYGQVTPATSTLVTGHSVMLSGLSPSTTYHYQVRSTDAQGLSASSANFTFTTPASPVLPPVLLHMAADATEVSGVTNNAVVTPTTAPAGFTGRVVVKGAGSVNFAPAHTGDGVYFLQCCSNTANAYYKFTGATVGQVFNRNQGQISFYLKSRYNLAQRPTGARYAFDVRDDDPTKHRLYFLTQVSSGSLLFAYGVGGATQFYFVPKGMEDALFGNGVTLKVTITWDGSTSRLYLNDVQVQAASYVKPSLNWSANSVFALGAYEYLTHGGYNALDDIIDEFVVRGP